MRFCTALVTGLLLVAGGCESMRSNSVNQPVVENKPSIDVQATSRTIAAGEITTLTIASRNTAGREGTIRWTSTGGDVRTEDNGRIARAYFRDPGAYTVTAYLEVDGREVATDSETITVRPLR